MSLAPDPSEQIARARGDLRMGVPIVIIDGPIGILVQAAETLTPERAADARALPGDTVLSITARRAETLKARAYDGDLARIHVPEGADLRWIIALADPADDLRTPMKGPLRSVRDGKAGAHRIALRLAKDARLLPSVLITDLDNPGDFATKHDLTTLFTVQVEPLLGVSGALP